MTRKEALVAAFAYGLRMLEDNARDLAKEDPDYDGPISEHPYVVECKQAIAVLEGETLRD